MIAVAPTYSSLASRSIIAAPLAQFTVDWILILAQRAIRANKKTTRRRSHRSASASACPNAPFCDRDRTRARRSGAAPVRRRSEPASSGRRAVATSIRASIASCHSGTRCSACGSACPLPQIDDGSPGLDVAGHRRLYKISETVPCSAAAQETDGSTTCVGIEAEPKRRP
jgi:hypothetical protein